MTLALRREPGRKEFSLAVSYLPVSVFIHVKFVRQVIFRIIEYVPDFDYASPTRSCAHARESTSDFTVLC